jgi:uncharacterized protein (DUF302 family)
LAISGGSFHRWSKRIMTASGYGYVRSVSLSFSDAVSKAEAALKKEGFGVLCQIDIQSKLKEKLGVDFPAT